MGNNPDITHTTMYCDFCGKSQHQIKKLVTGPRVAICDECVIVCVEVMVSNSPALQTPQPLHEQDPTIIREGNA